MTSAFDRLQHALGRRLARGLAVAVLVLAEHPRAQAQAIDAETRTAAREIALQGAEAFEAKDYGVALDRFQRASTLLRAPSISVMEARSLAALGRLVQALDKYEETQRFPLGSAAPEAFRRAVTEARIEAQAVRARIPRLELRVRSSRYASQDIRITLDGKPVPPALLDVQRPVDPGSHEIHAGVEGHKPVRRLLQFEEGQSIVLELDLDSELLGPSATRTRGAEQTNVAGARDGPRDLRDVLGWIGVGVGGAGLAISLGAGLSAWDRKSELDAGCKPGCPSELADELDSFRAHRTLSYLSLGVGTAALTAGGYFLLTGTRHTRRVEARLTLAGAGLVGAF